MLRFTRILPPGNDGPPPLTVTLDHEQRRRSRLRVALSDGREVGIVLSRGRPLRDGDRLESEDGSVVAGVRASPEHVSVASTADAHLLTRAAYHLGNRHVPLAIESGRLLYPHDHVLDGMCRELGLDVTALTAPFEPEHGGYSGGHAHAHDSPSEASHHHDAGRHRPHRHE